MSPTISSTPRHGRKVRGRVDSDPVKFVKNLMDKEELPLSALRREAQRLANAKSLNRFMSKLEIESVSHSCLVDYLYRIMVFISMAVTNRRNWCDAPSLDLALVLTFDDMRAMLFSARDASKMSAAIKFMFPEVSRNGALSLPRAHRAVKTWMVRDPPAQRIPFPWLCLAAVLGVLLWENKIAIALPLLIQFVTYLRPGVCDAITVGQLVAPSPIAGTGFQLWGILLNPREMKKAGKTGGFDDAVLLDTHLSLHDFLKVLIHGKPLHAPLWGVTGAVIIENFKRVTNVLGMDAVDACRYRLRHGGAAHDLLSQCRSLTEIKSRGHWSSESSVKRYTKATRSLKLLSLVDKQVLEYGRQVSDQLERVLRRSVVLAPPPTRLAINASNNKASAPKKRGSVTKR